MYSTVEDRAGPAVKCHLYELPSTLMYEVTKKLDVSSQRSLFLSSLQLYKQWHLQISEEDHEWHFLSWSLDMLAQISPRSGCSTIISETCIHAAFRDIDHKAIIFCPDQQQNDCTFEQSCSHTTLQDNMGTIYTAMLTSIDKNPEVHSKPLIYPTYLDQGPLIKEQLLKICISSPGLSGSSIKFYAKDTANEQELQALAHCFFSLLHKHEGYVYTLFATPGHAPLFEGLLVTHLQDGWKIDNKPCIASPSLIDLSACTEEGSALVRVWLRLYSRGSLASGGLAHINWLSEHRMRY